MLTTQSLIELALGAEEARKVDTAIPQHIFDGMTPVARENIAGWYYAPEVKLMGRLLTREECWSLIKLRLREGKLTATMAGGENIGYTVANWHCLRDHACRGELQIKRLNEYSAK
jgi:hypothetical protein